MTNTDNFGTHDRDRTLERRIWAFTFEEVRDSSWNDPRESFTGIDRIKLEIAELFVHKFGREFFNELAPEALFVAVNLKFNEMREAILQSEEEVRDLNKTKAEMVVQLREWGELLPEAPTPFWKATK